MKGFTLLEILIALAIFSMIGITTVKHIQQIQTTKDTALEDMDTYNGVRSAISIMRSDLNQAYHVLYDDLDPDLKKDVQKNLPVPHTLFDGRKSELVFTTLSHRVYYAGAKECDQAEISYFLQPKKGENSFNLMKRESGLIDGDLYQGGGVFTVLENVVSLEFKFWDNRNLRWVDDWNSDNGEFRDKFPMAIKAKLVVSQKGKKNIEVLTEFKVAFPNNNPTIASF
jgi:type II secretion system protein J